MFITVFIQKASSPLNEIEVYFLIIVIMTNGELLIWLIIPVHLTSIENSKERLFVVLIQN